MSSNCMVSIICNTYNHEKYIKETLESLINQKTDFEYEILVHDDASTDKTPEIIKEYENEYPNIIKPIYQTENQHSKRVGISRKFQYPRAIGKYIAFCEGDDFWTDVNKLQKQVDFLEKHPEYIACVHKYKVVDEESAEYNIKTFGDYENEGDYTFNDFFSNELPSQVATLLVRNIFSDKKDGYPKEFSKANIPGDIVLYFYILIHGKIYRMSDTMSAYRFIHKKDGKSYSSRIMRKAFNYKYWQGLCEFEKIIYEVYGIKVYFKERRLIYAVGVITDLRKAFNMQNFKNAGLIILKQPGTLKAFIKMLLKKFMHN